MKGSVVSVVVLLLGVFPLMVRSGGSPRVCNTMSLRRVHVHGLCGDSFTNTLDSLCHRRLIRSDPLTAISRLKRIILEKKTAMEYLEKRSGATATCECCFNQCSLQELIEYCP